MTKEDIEIFNRDVGEYGAYKYTDVSKYSACLANHRFSEEIIFAINCSAKRIIDIGCGDGTYTQVLAERLEADYILGIDPAAHAIETAQNKTSSQKNPNLSFRCAFARDIAKEEKTFDIAIMRGVIHHTENPEEEIKESLKLAPIVIILEPNGHNPVLKLIERFSSYHIEHNEKSFTYSLFNLWISNSGGKIHYLKYFGLVPMFCPAWFANFARLLEPILENIPWIGKFYCGQMLIVVRKIDGN